MLWWWLIACEPGGEEGPDIGDCDVAAAEGETGRMVGFVASHNAIREEYGLAPLVWDDDLAAAAAEWIEVLSTERDCQQEHNLDSPLGENLAWNSGFDSHACRVTEGWAQEVEFWDFETDTCTSECGHWTQIVWDTTERVGCAVTDCADDPEAEIWMCTYDPPGNVPGEPPF